MRERERERDVEMMLMMQAATKMAIKEKQDERKSWLQTVNPRTQKKDWTVPNPGKCSCFFVPSMDTFIFDISGQLGYNNRFMFIFIEIRIELLKYGECKKIIAFEKTIFLNKWIEKKMQ